MHSCDDTESVFRSSVLQADKIADRLHYVNEEVMTIAEDMNVRAAALQKSFGAAGDPAAADLTQKAKEWAGELQHATEASNKLCKEALKTSGEKVSDFTSHDGIARAEELTAQLEDQTRDMEKSLEEQNDLWTKAFPSDSHEMEVRAGFESDAGKQYYEAMYFVDKAAVGKPSTCSGDAAAKPYLDQSFDECAASCNANIGSCVGFQFMKGNGNYNGLCFLFSNFRSLTYYTGCDGGEPMKKKLQFLQRERSQSPEHGEETMCFAKFSYFEGTTLKPDASGKCKQCFKDVTKADRCFE